MIDVLAGFIQELRRAGLPVSLTENLDAMEAVRHIPLEDREAFKYALAATLVKRDSHWKAFDTVFELYFAFRRPAGDEGPAAEGAAAEEAGAMAGAEGGGGLEGLSPEELAELLLRALREGDEALLRALARNAVRRFAGMEPGRPVGGSYYLYRTLRHLELDGVLERLLREAQDTSEAPSGLEQRLLREELQARIDRLAGEVEAEIRRQLVADRGAEAMARTVRRPLPEDVDFMHASREELVMLRRAIYPLTRRLAVRLARKRRHRRRGPLDFRSTVRHSLSYGGVPAEPKFRHTRPHKPEIVVVADISGSVAAFARFTLQFVYAMSAQFSKVRSFVFIDGIDEVTRLFEGADDVGDAVHRINTEADVVWVDGHSDYGHAFEVLWSRWGGEITSKSSVIFLGDARNNYHAAQAWVVKEIADRARHVYWLNPEPRAYWDTGDSIVSEYAAHCDGVFECRNLRQLERFVEQLA
ncbi:MAG TPA: VWA domain-containing protein [Acidimicrobiales bacterium]|nr:VWA domain-containing protein [Acidimicrobiales bacterium]